MRLASIDAAVDELLRDGYTLYQADRLFEDRLIHGALLRAKGNVTQASRKLAIHRNTLHNKIRERRESRR